MGLTDSVKGQKHYCVFSIVDMASQIMPTLTIMHGEKEIFNGLCLKHVTYFLEVSTLIRNVHIEWTREKSLSALQFLINELF